jgi:hypothetical protein
MAVMLVTIRAYSVLLPRNNLRYSFLLEPESTLRPIMRLDGLDNLKKISATSRKVGGSIAYEDLWCFKMK